MKAAVGFLLCAFGIALVVVGIVAGAFAIAGAYDRSWSCPPGSLVVLDGFGFKAGCVMSR